MSIPVRAELSSPLVEPDFLDVVDGELDDRQPARAAVALEGLRVVGEAAQRGECVRVLHKLDEAEPARARLAAREE